MWSTLALLPLATLALGAAHSAPLASGIAYLGRVNPATNELTWPSTGIAFKFTGTHATIGVDASSIIGNNSMALYIDDQDPFDIPQVTGDIVTPVLPHGSHTVMLRKRSETVIGTFSLTNVTTDGNICTSSDQIRLPSRQIEIIGDSISVGYGTDGVFPCVNSAAVEDSPETYGATAARLLDADYSIVAWSGKGLVRNYITDNATDSPIMPELWTRYGADDADNSYTFPSSWNPAAVVITLGTNDFGFYPDARPQINDTQFSEAMVSFVKKVALHYTNAEFFLVSSPMLGDGYPPGTMQHTELNQDLMNAVAVLSETTQIRSHFVNWPSQGPVHGCDYHPTPLTHATQGYVLANAIGTALGW